MHQQTFNLSDRIYTPHHTWGQHSALQNLSYRYTRGGTRKQRKIKTITGHRPTNRVTLNNRLQRSQKFTGVNNANLITIKVHQEPPVLLFQAQCGLLNVRSIRNKSVEFKEFVEDHHMDFIALTETWLKPTDDYIVSEFCPPGFNVKHIPRTTDTYGGGVALVFRNSLDIKLQNLNSSTYTSFEIIEGLLNSGTTSYRIGCVYRPPPSAKNKLTEKVFLQEFGNYLSIASLESEHLLILGDFNFHMENKDYYGSFDSLLREQHVIEPTHGNNSIPYLLE